MFYIRNIIYNKLGVVDTSDGVCEYYTREELSSFGVAINQSLDDLDLKNSLEKRMLKKLYYLGLKGEHNQFFNTYCLPSVDEMLGQDGRVGNVYKFFNYHETHGLQVYVLTVYINSSENKLILVVRDDGVCWYKCLCGSDWVMSYYPSGSGHLYNNLFHKKGFCLSLDTQLLFLLFYKLGKAYLVKVGDLSVMEVGYVDKFLQ